MTHRSTPGLSSTPAPPPGRSTSPGSSFPTPGRGAVIAMLLLLTAGLPACITVSQEDEIAMGRDFARQINEELPLIQEPAIRDPISDVGLDLAEASPRPDMPYQFQIVNTNVINAFAVPGGFIYMNRGLIQASDRMSEVVGVLAHEVGHIVGRHSAEQIERAQNANLGLALGSIIFGAPGQLARIGVNVGANLYFSKHSRSDEAEADSLAVALMLDTGWDPRGFLSFLRTMLDSREDRPGTLESLFASHPLTEERIASVRAMLDRIPPERFAGLRDDTSQYHELKEALSQYPPPPERFRVEENPEPEEESGDDAP